MSWKGEPKNFNKNWTCTWTETENGEYETECGEQAGSGMGWKSEEPEFCKYCGKPVRIQPYYEER